MRKLRLDLDDLCVEAFTTSGAETNAGTVHGHYPTYTCDTDVSCVQTCFFDSCFDTDCYCNVHTYAETCGETCGYNCSVSCGNSCVQTCFTCTNCNTCLGMDTCDNSCRCG